MLKLLGSFLLSFLLFSNLAQAQLLAEVPESYCHPQYYDCSAAIKDIVSGYFNSSAPQLSLPEGLYAGSCYMLSKNYDPSHQHHGYIYLRARANSYDFYGTFAYFYEEDPYKDLTLEQVRLRHPEDSKYQVSQSTESWQVVTSIEPPWQYFMRAKDHELYLIGFWDKTTTINCKLQTKN